MIAYDPVWDRSARSLAAALPGARLKPVAGQGEVMQLTLGADFTGVRPVRLEGPHTGENGLGAVTGEEVACPEETQTPVPRDATGRAAL